MKSQRKQISPALATLLRDWYFIDQLHELDSPRMKQALNAFVTAHEDALNTCPGLREASASLLDQHKGINADDQELTKAMTSLWQRAVLKRFLASNLGNADKIGGLCIVLDYSHENNRIEAATRACASACCETDPSAKLLVSCASYFTDDTQYELGAQILFYLYAETKSTFHLGLLREDLSTTLTSLAEEDLSNQSLGIASVLDVVFYHSDPTSEAPLSSQMGFPLCFTDVWTLSHDQQDLDRERELISKHENVGERVSRLYRLFSIAQQPRDLIEAFVIIGTLGHKDDALLLEGVFWLFAVLRNELEPLNNAPVTIWNERTAKDFYESLRGADPAIASRVATLASKFQ